MPSVFPAICAAWWPERLRTSDDLRDDADLVDALSLSEARQGIEQHLLPSSRTDRKISKNVGNKKLICQERRRKENSSINTSRDARPTRERYTVSRTSSTTSSTASCKIVHEIRLLGCSIMTLNRFQTFEYTNRHRLAWLNQIPFGMLH